jgi:hypothetical protein
MPARAESDLILGLYGFPFLYCQPMNCMELKVEQRIGRGRNPVEVLTTGKPGSVWGNTGEAPSSMLQWFCVLSPPWHFCIALHLRLCPHNIYLWGNIYDMNFPQRPHYMWHLFLRLPSSLFILESLGPLKVLKCLNWNIVQKPWNIDFNKYLKKHINIISMKNHGYIVLYYIITWYSMFDK